MALRRGPRQLRGRAAPGARALPLAPVFEWSAAMSRHSLVKVSIRFKALNCLPFESESCVKSIVHCCLGRVGAAASPGGSPRAACALFRLTAVLHCE